MQEYRHIVTYHYRVVRQADTTSMALSSLDMYRQVLRVREASGNTIKPELVERGGATATVVKSDRTRKYAIGISICSPTDFYVKEYGIAFSKKRAIKALREGNKVQGATITERTRVEPFAIKKIEDFIYYEMPLRYIKDDDTESNQQEYLSYLVLDYMGIPAL